MGFALTVTIRKVSEAHEEWRKQGPGSCLVLSHLYIRGVSEIGAVLVHAYGAPASKATEEPGGHAGRYSESWLLSHPEGEAYF